jgi:hypothetical protein
MNVLIAWGCGVIGSIKDSKSFGCSSSLYTLANKYKKEYKEDFV